MERDCGLTRAIEQLTTLLSTKELIMVTILIPSCQHRGLNDVRRVLPSSSSVVSRWKVTG